MRRNRHFIVTGRRPAENSRVDAPWIRYCPDSRSRRLRSSSSRTLLRTLHATRGSVFILVLAILTVLALLMMTLSYVSRVELQATENWLDGLQATVSSVTGLPAFETGSTGNYGTAGASGRGTSALTASAAAASRGLLSLGPAQVRTAGVSADDSSRLLFSDADRPVDSGTRIEPLTLKASPRQAPVVPGAIAFSQVEDESAKINLNAIVMETDAQSKYGAADDLVDLLTEPEYQPPPVVTTRQFAEFLDALFEEKGISPRVNAQTLARRVVEYRLGPDGAPGRAGFDDNGNGRPQPRGDSIQISGAEEATFRYEGRSARLPSSEVRVMPDGESVRFSDFPRSTTSRDSELRYAERDGLDNDFDGEIDEYQEGIDEPEEAVSDLRKPRAGDDRIFARVEDLRRIRGMSEEVIAAMAPYVTVFSVSRPGAPFNSGETEGLLQIDPNIATPEEIFAVLAARYPHLPEALLGQFTVNMIDRRDRDDAPTEIQLGSEGRTYRGVEITPYINEVMPDVATFPEDGDDGQFVEIYNPYSHSINLTGWRLETDTSAVMLDGYIPSEGLIVITDDYDETNDPDPEDEPGLGSLYDIFQVVAVPPNLRVIEDILFDLPDSAGTVRLYNANGTLVDSFAYENGTFSGAHFSFQRIDPRVNVYEEAMATPLEKNTGLRQLAEADREMLELVQATHNRPFRSPLELLFVSTSYVPSDRLGEADDRIAREVSWRYPSLDGADDDNLDAGVVDSFMPGAPRAEVVASAQPVSAIDFGDFSDDPEIEDLLAELNRTYRLPEGVQGLINVNTASPAVLAALPGMSPALAERIALLRGAPLPYEEIEDVDERYESAPENEPEHEPETDDGPESSVVLRGQLDMTATESASAGVFEQVAPTEDPRPRIGSNISSTSSSSNPGGEVDASRHYNENQPRTGRLDNRAWYQARSPQDSARWNSLSQFLRDDQLWRNAPLLDRVKQIYPFSRMIAFHSLAYKVTTQSVPVVVRGDEKRRPSTKRAQRILTADRGGLETVSFRYQTQSLAEPKELQAAVGDALKQRAR